MIFFIQKNAFALINYLISLIMQMCQHAQPPMCFHDVHVYLLKKILGVHLGRRKVKFRLGFFSSPDIETHMIFGLSLGCGHQNWIPDPTRVNPTQSELLNYTRVGKLQVGLGFGSVCWQSSGSSLGLGLPTCISDQAYHLATLGKKYIYTWRKAYRSYLSATFHSISCVLL